MRDGAEPRGGKPRTSGHAAKPNWENSSLAGVQWPPIIPTWSLSSGMSPKSARIVARQRELIVRLRAAGPSTSGAEETLKAFEGELLGDLRGARTGAPPKRMRRKCRHATARLETPEPI